MAKDCPEDKWVEDELGWFDSPFRYQYHANDEKDQFPKEICDRCEELDLVRFVTEDLPHYYCDHDWHNNNEVIERKSPQSQKHTRSLGKVCRCLFGLCPNASSCDQAILLLPSSTLYRLEGEITIDTEAKKRTAKAITVMLDPTDILLRRQDYGLHGDALCLMQEDAARFGQHLGGKRIDPKHIDINQVQGWLTKCSKLHPVT
ncbi:MAG: hypothetical protein M1820_002551 [Bogoriella megaspora]|nr:MAG: hypothetical protein M1820_002551 [Bogoriella megaspora]